MPQRFLGLERLYGPEACARLRAARVMVVGLGGVGGWTVEALARSGVGGLALVDADEVCVSNTNRQIHALAGSFGRPKALALAERVQAIAPATAVEPLQRFFTKTSAAELLGCKPDLVIDAMDSLSNKALLIAECRTRGLPVVVCGGAGGKKDPFRIRRGDLGLSEGDALLMLLRKKLRRAHGFPRGEGRKFRIPCVWSDEKPVLPWEACGLPAPAAAEGPVKLDCAEGFGAACHLAGTFGFMLAAIAVELLTTPAPADAPAGA